MNLENDCEDQGYTAIADGCTVCVVWEHNKRVKIHLVVESRLGKKWWMCPRCEAFYGEKK